MTFRYTLAHMRYSLAVAWAKALAALDRAMARHTDRHMDRLDRWRSRLDRQHTDLVHHITYGPVPKECLPGQAGGSVRHQFRPAPTEESLPLSSILLVPALPRMAPHTPA